MIKNSSTKSGLRQPRLIVVLFVVVAIVMLLLLFGGLIIWRATNSPREPFIGLWEQTSSASLSQNGGPGSQFEFSASGEIILKTGDQPDPAPMPSNGLLKNQLGLIANYEVLNDNQLRVNFKNGGSQLYKYDLWVQSLTLVRNSDGLTYKFTRLTKPVVGV